MISGPHGRRKVSKLVGERSSSFDLARGRLVFISGLFVMAYMMVAARAIDLAVIQGRTAAPARYVEAEEKKETLPPAIMRADITDRNGVLLATTLKTTTLYADPYLIASKEEAAAGLAKIFSNLSSSDLLKKLQAKRVFLVKRDLSPEQQNAVLLIGEPGLAFREEPRRVYPQGALTSHLVGFSSVDRQGLAGVERNFNKDLAAGDNMQLTLDIRIQHALHREMEKAMKDFNAIGAAGVVMDANNGEILAGVSLPDFDPHDAGNAGPDRVFNRLTLGTYELGSVFKIFSTAAYLDSTSAPLSKTFDASKPLQIGKYKIEDYHAENRILTIPEIFMVSSNIGAAMMGEAIGTLKLRKFYDDFGLLSQMDFEIPEVGKPLIPNPWRDVNTVTAAYGHGISTTPMQVASAVASIVNGGTLVTPHLLPQEDNDDPQRVVSAETAHRIRQLMRLVVTDGTGMKADVPGYNIGGKTGTAEKSAGGRYDKNRLISSFAAAFPIESPRYVIYVVVDEPKGNRESSGFATAGWVAAPIVSRVVTSMASILGLPPEAADEDPGSSLRQYVSTRPHE